ncbi:MAG: hypothetical protein K0U52_12190 [Gammaproteobacteria bacterium]|nr:hypothetical protein [Gammaproteobacteria bacterium]
MAQSYVDISDRDALSTDWFYDENIREEITWEDKRKGPCVAYVFGCMQDKTSVCVTIHDFRPWIYIENPKRDWTPSTARLMGNQLAKYLKLESTDIQTSLESKMKVFGWHPKNYQEVNERKHWGFTKITFPSHTAMRKAEGALKDKRIPSLKFIGKPINVCEFKVQMYSKILQQRELTASGWLTIQEGNYRVQPLTHRCSSVQLEVNSSMRHLDYNDHDAIAPILTVKVDIEAQPDDFRSFPDASKPNDPVTYIGSTFSWYGDATPCLRVMQVLGQVEESQETEGMVVLCYPTEKELLAGWRDLIVLHTDPDQFVSYNGTKFDYKYLMDRWSQLSIRCRRFVHLNRFWTEVKESPLKEKVLTSAALGENSLYYFDMSGRFQVDLFMYLKSNGFKLSSFTLDDVCKHFLKGDVVTGSKVVLDYPHWVIDEVESLRPHVNQVLTFLEGNMDCTIRPQVEALLESASATASLIEDNPLPENMEERWMPVHNLLQEMKELIVDEGDKIEWEEADWQQLVNLIRVFDPALDSSGDDNYRKTFRLYARGPRERGYVARYCQVDCDLLLHLMNTLSVIPNMVKMSQVTQTVLMDIAIRGQQIKTFNLIYRVAAKQGYIVNTEDVGWDVNAEYKGATVIDAKSGYYTDPVATLDFASLYPSIMRGHNLCFSALVLDKNILEKLEYLESHGAVFKHLHLGGKDWVFEQHMTGILPDILTNLLSARKAKKREMKKYDKDSMEYKLCDAAQLALKLTCNAVYGFTGVDPSKGMMSCMPIANATTFIGRQMIDETKAYVEQQGYEVIYGDTDSVMVLIPNHTMEEVFAIAEELAEGATQLFPDTVLLEFEKVFCPKLLVKKKTYAGMKYEDDPFTPPRLDVKGLAVVRRDNCKLLRDIMGTLLHKVMRDSDAFGAYYYLEEQLENLAYGRVPISDLVITKSLKGNYKSECQPQVTVVNNMLKRKALDTPQVGDRVPFVIVEGKDPRMFSRAEHPKYVQKTGLKVDLMYYLKNQLTNHIYKIMTPLPTPNIDALYSKAEGIIQRNRLGVRPLTDFLEVDDDKPMKKAKLEIKKRKVDTSKQQGLFGREVHGTKKKGKKRTKKDDGMTQQALSSFFK